MSKAVSWNRAGGGFDPREAARDAARRQGKSLGEWLHGVIADNAGGERAGAATDRERIEALTTRLERMGLPAASGRATPRQGSIARSEAESVDDTPRGRPRAVEDPVEDPDARHDGIARAFKELQHRTLRSKRRAEDAIASVAELIEKNERRRDRDRAGVESLADKLADIEARLSVRDETPIKGTLARLEARLEQIGRRGEAESSARALATAQLAAPPQADGEPIRRLDEKLNAVLDALASSRAPELASPALPGTIAKPFDEQVEPPLRRRRLGEAIAEIAERQRSLDVGTRLPPRDRGTRIAEGGPLSNRLDDIRRAMAAPRATALGMTGPSESNAAIGALRAEMQSMGERLQDVQAQVAHPPTPDLTVLESLVRDLGLRLEAVQAPGADAQAFDALQDRIGTLATRLERTETGLASLGSLDRSMRELFAHLEETRSYAESAATRAATEAVRSAVAERGFDRPAPRADVAVLKAMQEDADLRTRATLDVVHEALEKVVDRLAVVEHGLAEARVAGATRDEARPRARLPEGEARESDTPRAPIAASLELGAAEPLVAPRSGARAPSARTAPDVDAGAGRSEFIAAARRAAHAAQTDPAVVAIRRPAPAAEPMDASEVRASLALKSRDYVTSHKRPVLMALAAVLVVAATMALMQRLPFQASGPELAEAPATPSQVAADATPSRAPATARYDAMAPQPAPRATPALAARIPGSDPIVTGSIPSLPAFAARSPGVAAAPAAKPTLAAGLAEAAEAGDAGAQYTLASAYAEGRAVPRDLAHAAKLYAKAADKGIVPAQYRLGALYEKGLGVPQDKARARSLYQEAADAGSPRAMHNLAVLLADGDGKPDYESAATWFRRAAQLGVHDSQFNLAILLARGLGVDQSLVQSYQWFAIAAQLGDGDAASKRDEVAAKLSPSELSVAKALAAAFHPRQPDPAAVDVAPPPGGWDGGQAPLHLSGARSKISSL